MASRRPRIVRSSSQGEIEIFNQIQPIDYPVAWSYKKHSSHFPASEQVIKDSKPLMQREKQPRPRIFTLGSPEREASDAGSKRKPINEGFCEFLKACSLCKKKLIENEDVFMYGYLQAFCSSDCRDDQIALDGFDEEVFEESVRMEMAGNLMKEDTWRWF